MPDFRDIVYGMYGAWRLALLDKSAMQIFDRSVAGFWKSFFAAVIVLPGYALVIFYDVSEQDVSAGWPRIVVVSAIAYVMGWVFFPLAVHTICGMIGKQKAFIGYIVALNWAEVIQISVYLPVMVLTATNALTPGATGLLNTAVVLLLSTYAWFIARTALGVSTMGAVGFVMLNMIIALFIRETALGMIL